jgi:hypothetical protein
MPTVPNLNACRSLPYKLVPKNRKCGDPIKKLTAVSNFSIREALLSWTVTADQQDSVQENLTSLQVFHMARQSSYGTPLWSHRVSLSRISAPDYQFLLFDSNATYQSQVETLNPADFQTPRGHLLITLFSRYVFAVPSSIATNRYNYRK